jgi:hypothetical protein
MALASRPALTPPQQPPDSAHQLVVELLGRRVGRAADDAVAGVIVEQAERHLVERGLDGGDLGDDVDAVAVFLDHALDAAYLALEAPKALEQLVLGSAVAALPGGGVG